MKNNLLDQLVELRESDFYPFHMPGHKRAPVRELPVTKLDITEIDGFDNLYAPEGILKQCMERAAKLYGSREALLGVNGSTGSLLVAISAAFNPGETVLVARNCHKAVYHALELRGLNPVFLYPETDCKFRMNEGITLREVKACFEAYEAGEAGKKAPIAGMILTSPTYEGVVSQTREIADFMHDKNAVLIVDEAHGAHFGFHPAFPESAIRQGADLVIQSLHKTLPAMTQTSLLHIVTDRVDASVVRKYFGMYQTSSPSYVLMASIDECLSILETDGKALFDHYACLLEDFYKETRNLSALQIVDREGKEPGKIVIAVPKERSALKLYETLRETYHLQPEMCGLHHVLMMTSIFDTKEGMARLQTALQKIDSQYSQQGNPDNLPAKEKPCEADFGEAEAFTRMHEIKPKRRLLPGETQHFPTETLPFADCAGRVSAEYLYLYPPGIPYVIPGEEVPGELIPALEFLQKKGYRLLGNQQENRLLVVCEDAQ